MSDEEMSEEGYTELSALQERAWRESPEGKIKMLRALAGIGDIQRERMKAQKKTYTRNSQEAREWQWNWMMATEKDLSGIYRCLADLAEAVVEINQGLAALKEPK